MTTLVPNIATVDVHIGTLDPNIALTKYTLVWLHYNLIELDYTFILLLQILILQKNTKKHKNIQEQYGNNNHLYNGTILDPHIV